VEIIRRYFMDILCAQIKDLQAILELQYLAYQSEAEIHNNYSIPPLTQTLEDVMQEYQNGTIFKAVDDNGIIVGSVRGYTKDNTLYIGKLIVDPSQQGRKIGSGLLHAIEQYYTGYRYELFTSSKSLKNIAIYEHLGYRKFKEVTAAPDLTLIYLEK
jgi:ribosomal protein S18 acetylase RimI-like enzyme